MTQILYSYILKENQERILRDYLSDFPKEFQQRMLKYRRWEDVQLSLTGRLLLRYGLKKMNRNYREEELSYSEYNKPTLLNDSVEFNISHSGNIVVCAITDTNDVGIDVEMIQDVNLEDFKLQMTEIEWQRISNSINARDAFFEYWTKKEAIIKADGMGLSIPLDSFEVIGNQTCVNDKWFFMKEVELDEDYKCHVAFKDRYDATVLVPQKVDFFATA